MLKSSYLHQPCVRLISCPRYTLLLKLKAPRKTVKYLSFPHIETTALPPFLSFPSQPAWFETFVTLKDTLLDTTYYFHHSLSLITVYSFHVKTSSSENIKMEELSTLAYEGGELSVSQLIDRLID